MALKLSAPVVIAEQHELSLFNSGNELLDNWLKKYAMQAKYSGTATTYVVCDRKNIVVAYFTLAMASIEQAEAARRTKKGTGNFSIPMVLLARLAVAKNFQGQGIGSGMLKEALLISIAGSIKIACHGMLVHPIDEKAIIFYEKYGFEPSPIGKEKLMILFKDAKKSLGI